MGTRRSRTFSLALLSIALSPFVACSGSKEAQVVTVAGSGGGRGEPGTNGDLAFTGIDASATNAKAFVQTKGFQWVIDDNYLFLSRSDGTSMVYARATGEWGPTESFADAASYTSIFAFHDGSYNGLKPGILSFRNGSNKLLTYDTSKVMPDGAQILGSGPGFYAAALSDGIMVVSGEGALATKLKIKSAPATFVEVGRCISGCVLWGHDGQFVYTFGNNDLWMRHKLPFAPPENKKIARYTFGLTLAENGALTIKSVAALSDEGLLYVSKKTGGANEAIKFEQVKKLTTTYCLGCHSAEGFDSEAGLKAQKTEIIRRLGLNADEPEVMPSKSAPRVMISTDKKAVISWLSLQTVGVDTGPVVTTPTTTTMDNSTVPVTDALLAQGQKYCFSCHPAAKFKAFWLDQNEGIKSRVTSGNMPAGKTMTPEDKAALLKAVGEVK